MRWRADHMEARVDRGTLPSQSAIRRRLRRHVTSLRHQQHGGARVRNRKGRHTSPILRRNVPARHRDRDIEGALRSVAAIERDRSGRHQLARTAMGGVAVPVSRNGLGEYAEQCSPLVVEQAALRRRVHNPSAAVRGRAGLVGGSDADHLLRRDLWFGYMHGRLGGPGRVLGQLQVGAGGACLRGRARARALHSRGNMEGHKCGALPRLDRWCHRHDVGIGTPLRVIKSCEWKSTVAAAAVVPMVCKCSTFQAIRRSAAQMRGRTVSQNKRNPANKKLGCSRKSNSATNLNTKIDVTHIPVILKWVSRCFIPSTTIARSEQKCTHRSGGRGGRGKSLRRGGEVSGHGRCNR